MDAWSRVARARAEGPEPLSRRMAQDFERAADEDVHYVIGGPYERLVRQVVLDAFSLVRARSLPGLLIVAVGPNPPQGAALETALALKARVLYRALPRPGFEADREAEAESAAD